MRKQSQIKDCVKDFSHRRRIESFALKLIRILMRGHLKDDQILTQLNLSRMRRTFHRCISIKYQFG